MKKFLITTITVLTLLFCILSFSASAQRVYNCPVTLTQATWSGETLFTITDITYYYPDLLDGENLYKKDLSFDIYGHFGTSYSDTGTIDLKLYCYDSYGNHITTENFTIDSSEGYDNSYFFSLNVPDITAFVEIAPAKPTWENTLFHNKYENVYSTDGRVLAIPELMLPVYESVGWHGPVWLYTPAGESIEVPFPQVSAYKQVGWLEFEDYVIAVFRDNYNYFISLNEYESILSDVETCLAHLSGTVYEPELYAAKTYALDQWRATANSPLGITGVWVNDDGEIEIGVRNISYNTIKAFKLSFTCYNVFGEIEKQEGIYYDDDCWLNPSDIVYDTWETNNKNVEYISNPVVTQVVYSDNTSWYR